MLFVNYNHDFAHFSQAASSPLLPQQQGGLRGHVAQQQQARSVEFSTVAVVPKRRGRPWGSPCRGQRDATERLAGEVPLELHDGRRWQPAGAVWMPVVARDWSNLAQAQANWRDYGASAYKQKDLNYFYVDDLRSAHRAGRGPKPERGRTEDPTAEVLIHSGETVRDEQGKDRFATVRGWHLPKNEWIKGPDGKPRTPPRIQRRVMDFGYAQHSKIDWIDCV